jgi:hypothetical protein
MKTFINCILYSIIGCALSILAWKIDGEVYSLDGEVYSLKIYLITGILFAIWLGLIPLITAKTKNIKKSKKAYVICCNDSVEFVVIDDEKAANEKLKELKIKSYETTKLEVHIDSFEDYERAQFWNIHEVNYN